MGERPNVINTRPLADQQEFNALIVAAGGAPVSSPVMVIDYLDPAAETSSASALAFTSANGVRAYARLDPDRSHTVFAVGLATAAAARKEGFSAIHTAGGDVDSLAQLIVSERSSFANARLRHVAGADRAGDLVGALAAAGVACETLVAYRAVSAAAIPDDAKSALMRGGGYVALFSPRSARLFCDLLTRAELEPAKTLATALCLSDAVADAAGDGWRGKLVATDRTAAGLADVFARDYATRRP